MHTNYFISNSPYGAMVWIVIERPASRTNEALLPAQDGTALWTMAVYYTTIKAAEKSVADSLEFEQVAGEDGETVRVIPLYA